MVTLAQRIEELRTEKGLSRPEFSQALGFPKNAAEKFETGRQTPTREQQEKMANYFGVSIFYLTGESNDRTRQEDWLGGAIPVEDGEEFRPIPAAPIKKQKAAPAAEGGMLDSVLATKQVRELLRDIVLDTLRSPEGQALILRAVKHGQGK